MSTLNPLWETLRTKPTDPVALFDLLSNKEKRHTEYCLFEMCRQIEEAMEEGKKECPLDLHYVVYRGWGRKRVPRWDESVINRSLERLYAFGFKGSRRDVILEEENRVGLSANKAFNCPVVTW